MTNDDFDILDAPKGGKCEKNQAQNLLLLRKKLSK